MGNALFAVRRVSMFHSAARGEKCVIGVVAGQACVKSQCVKPQANAACRRIPRSQIPKRMRISWHILCFSRKDYTGKAVKLGAGSGRYRSVFKHIKGGRRNGYIHIGNREVCKKEGQPSSSSPLQVKSALLLLKKKETLSGMIRHRTFFQKACE